MAELHTNLYFKHPDPETHGKLVSLMQTDSSSASIKQGFGTLAKSVLGEAQGLAAVNELFDTVGDEDELMAESTENISGYHNLYLVHGSDGDDIITALIKFLGSLYPDVDARACLVGDDDPWEIFFRWQNGQVKQVYLEPDEYEDADNDIYNWWHEGLPENIKDGFLNEDYDDDDEEY